MIVALGSLSLITIPKESSPNIKFGLINISTFYAGVSPIDMDQLITQEIEQAIKDIDGIKKITASSRVGISNVTIELESDAAVKDVMTEIKDEIDKVALPSDAEDPFVLEISTDSEVMFDLVIYGDRTITTPDSLKQLARSIKNKLTGNGSISSINIAGGDEFDIQLVLNRAKMEQMGITLNQVMNTIRSFNQNIPLGNFTVGELAYDFRIQGELENAYDLLDLQIIWTDSEVVLQDLWEIVYKYGDESVRTFWKTNDTGYYALSLTFNKSAWGNVFTTSAEAKKAIEELFQTQEFASIQHAFTNDLSEFVKEDYRVLADNARQTFALVFLFTVVFLSVKESVLATLSVPLSFLITFFVLDKLGSTLNFMTNFSLVLTLGIAIDAATVIVEAAGKNMKLWFDPKHAVLLAVKDFYKPLISGTMTTAIVFIPMMFLPGIIGKFLAFIPITIFTTLVASLFIALTLNTALFYKFSKKQTTYREDLQWERFLPPLYKELLAEDRVGKTALGTEEISTRQRRLDKMSEWYATFLRFFLAKKSMRRATVIVPFVGLIFTFVFFNIWFTLFPQSDNGFFWLTVTGKEWTTTQAMYQYLPTIEEVIGSLPEVKQYVTTTSNNSISINVDLLSKKERKEQKLRDVFAVESEVLERLQTLEQQGLKVASQVEWWGPPPAKPIGLKLIAENSEQFSELLTIANEFEQYLLWVDGTKNVAISSQPSPGQFTYEFNHDRLKSLGLTPSDIVWEISAAINWISAGSIRIQKEDRDIKVLYSDFADTVSPSAIEEMSITTRVGPVIVGEVLDYKIENAVGEIAREDTRITIRVDADLAEGRDGRGPELQAAFEARAQAYNFPSGINYNAAGEQQENAELISATFQGFFIAMFCIFVILVLQFNSFRKPVVIMYSVICALLWVNIGLLVTGNLYSMAFAIWFIALTGIIVNNAIIVIDRIRENVSRHIDHFDAIVEAGKSRLEPIIITTLNTLVWVLPITFQDKFREGLGITLIFGLFVGSIMTLFVIPSLYYIVFIKQKKEKVEVKKHRITNS